MTPPTCSIIIRAYNEEAHIGRLLKGILEQTITDLEIILVDSGSTDHTFQIAKRFPVRIVEIKPEEFTFGRALNLGISVARAPLVVMASAHVYPVYPDWLEKLLEPFSSPQTGLTYGKQRGAQGSHFSEQQIFLHWYADTSVARQDHPFCNNANAAIRRSLWRQHPYDETLPGLEDLEWGKWVQEQGFDISYSALAEIIHVHNESLAGIYNRYKREAMAFKRIYPHETFTQRDLVRLFMENVRSDWREARLLNVFSKNWLKIASFRWRQFYGTYQGYRRSGPLTWKLKQAFYYPHAGRHNPKQEHKRDVEPIQYN
jgi:glycosyltransferase involved in cell wall biosynthesis